MTTSKGGGGGGGGGGGKPPPANPPLPPSKKANSTSMSMSLGGQGGGNDSDTNDGEFISKHKSSVQNNNSFHRSPSTEKLFISMSSHNKRPRASMDGFPMEDDCHPRTLNSKRFLSDAMANELGWKWSLDTVESGSQSRRQSMDLDTTSNNTIYNRTGEHNIINSPSGINTLKRTGSASDGVGEDSSNNGGMDLLRRRAMKYAQEQKNKAPVFPVKLSALDVLDSSSSKGLLVVENEGILHGEEHEEEKNPTTPRDVEVAPASFYPASPSDQSPLMTNLRKAALLRSLRGKHGSGGTASGGGGRDNGR